MNTTEMNRQILLTEYVTAAGVPLPSGDAARLRRVVPTMSVAPSWSAPSTFDLTPGSEIGTVALDDATVIIRPKVPVGRVLFLVSYALDPARWQERSGDYDVAEDVVEAMVALFANELGRSLRRGLRQGYVTAEEALTTVRGRIRFDEQLRRRYSAPLPIEVRYDDYTPDTELNRVLLAALWRVSRLSVRSTRTRSMLAYGHAVLSENVTLVDYARNELPAFRWNRLNRQFRVPVELALLILRSSSLELNEGRHVGTAFLIDMNTVFEEFVRVALREELRLSESEFPPGHHVSAALDEADRIKLEPDLSWWTGAQCRFVGDAKYKRINVKGVNHPDIYQLLAYATALNLPSGLLVYAAGEAESVEHLVRYAGKRLEVTTIDLAGSPDDILREVARIARRVRRLAREGDLTQAPAA